MNLSLACFESGKRLVGLSRALAVGSLTLAACAGTAPSSTAPPQPATSAAPEPAPAPAPAEPAAAPASSAPAPSEAASTAKPASQDPRFKKALETVEQLMGSDLGGAEKSCASRPEAERQGCVGTIMAARAQARDATMADESLAVHLLHAEAEAKCKGGPPEKHEECLVFATEARLTALQPACPAKTSELVHRCIVLKVIGAKSP